jgi:hypothetical protein
MLPADYVLAPPPQALELRQPCYVQFQLHPTRLPQFHLRLTDTPLTMEAPSSGAQTGDGRLGTAADERGSKSIEGVVEEPRSADARADEPASDEESDLDVAELTAIMNDFDTYLAERGWGRLFVHVVGPIDVWLRVSAVASWSVSEQDEWPQQVEAEAKGFVRQSNASLGMTVPFPLRGHFRGSDLTD